MNTDAPGRTHGVAHERGKAAQGRRQRSRGDVSLFHLIYQGAAILGMLLGSYLFFSHFVVQSVRVSGTSMLPTLREADFYFVNRLACLFRSPRHGDIVLLKDPTDRTYAVKRVIGAEGDTVELRSGGVYLNGTRLDEPYLLRGTQTFPFSSVSQTVRCGPGQFFVLGDNRFFSSDSRTYGAVSRSAILGLVMR
jgi:signal peptidase I